MNIWNELISFDIYTNMRCHMLVTTQSQILKTQANSHLERNIDKETERESDKEK